MIMEMSANESLSSEESLTPPSKPKTLVESDTEREIGAASVEGGPEENAVSENRTQFPEKKRLLTPEEQMALYEEALKEEDWGHQPC